MPLTLTAAGLLDVDAGEIIRPGIVTVDDGRIVSVGGEIASDATSSTSATPSCCPV